ncbi:acyltransferase [Acinetobacter sp. C26M]|uniref:acyltransferase family protein n=1 Tax=unclassified Acinetobacter TaxID=196816 RepID=UPI00203714B1|nr:MULTISPECIES: acyltransferase family protein [unclassified Acinetobacter]USA46496.1 acyltransferase [Acinetobacter sp. C26M]USA49980.1 acyltransferase [Acinetobacter sp. C26G]
MTRNAAIDILKLCLSFLVVMLHCSLFKDINTSLYYLTVNGLFRIAVPLFLIITGYYFFYIDDFKKLIHWGRRILILYLIWMLFYISFWFSSSSLLANIKSLFWGYFVLWYLIGTFFGGLLVYLIRNRSWAFQLGSALLCFFIGYIIQTSGNLHSFPKELDSFLNNSRNYRNFFMMCFPFMMIGFGINKYKLDRKININLYMILFLMLLLLIESFVNYYFVNNKEALDLLIMLLLVSPAILIFTLNKKVYNQSKNLAALSTAVYLIHPIVMYELAKTIESNSTIIYTIIVLLLSIFLGYLLTILNKKLKYLL